MDDTTPCEIHDELSEETVKTIQTAIDEHPYLRWLGLRVEKLGSGRALLSVAYQEKLANPGGPRGLHGGVSSSVLDTAGAIAIATNFDEPLSALGQGSVSTMDLNVTYLCPATGDLSVTADVLHLGRSTAVTQIIAQSDRMGSEDRQNVVVGRGTYRIHG